MSCVAQKMKPAAASDWTATFPNEIQTETQSTVFVKKLIALTVSSITYLRAIFPESAFGNRSIEDLRLKILSENSGCHGASQLISWIKGSFDALEKKYLRQLMIGIYESPDEPDNVIESYTFRFIYENDSTMIMW
ncbi:HORMA domain-containing protein 1-like [Centruroides sculpturatus]|uniref:HORMA domain-containing protein 1-like n=1 Tax=Centruroides sculpturatus TaxID=218467 RepID=UPI000C6E4231|nr:HORMA domain-containing protein 1-like [Centruroides sculpturatus]